MALMISVSGIRGVFGLELTPEDLVRYAAAFGAWCERGKVVLGRDTRPTSVPAARIVASTLQCVGCEVVDIGVAPTPTVGVAVRAESARGGLVITASHNPPEWNALKMLGPDGAALSAQDGRSVLELARSGRLRYVPYRELGGYRKDKSHLEQHIERILALPYLPLGAIRARHFRIVLDAVNGAGSLALPRLLDRLGCEVIPLHCNPQEPFPHPPEPLPEHLGELMDAVLRMRADLGVAVDPDADRLALVQEDGVYFGEEYTLVAAAAFVLRHRPGPLVANLSTTRALEDVAAQHGQLVYRTPVGERHVIEGIRLVGAVLGGEGNGGVILPEIHEGRDALTGLALILGLLAETGLSLSGLRAHLPRYEMIKDRLEGLPRPALERLFEAIQQAYAGRAEFDTRDGLKVILPDCWIHLRASNTEPIARLHVEARTRSEAEALAQEVRRWAEAVST
ncbi:MAG: phosphoglucosamine mutase [Bacteroidetes bacterium]|nr:phosphoglucosamine mutase [Rhodothermia bacterium]MCS7154229.1 phosphoglucosamine mutase [Bacteroidota bacterium]MCX7906735.1 phosphoglucosamine mutase [Bacteroidota bacterium]MDW8136985.1 phosphoglucosamine mutase [Bacteroidota bacterium]MDW8285144.1 phosphoglucosamine mutase [Bacteroidota bacterium]